MHLPSLSPITTSTSTSYSLCHMNQKGNYSHDLLVYKYLQAEVVINLRTFADACAHPSAKCLVLRGRTGPVNAVEVDGMLFIKNDEAEAATEAIRSKAIDPASEVAVASEVAPAPKPTAGSAAALKSEPSRSVVSSSATVYPISYAAAASKPPVGLKPSVASSKFSSGLKHSAPASQPAVVVAPLEVSMLYRGMHDEHILVHICRCNVCMCTRM